MGGAQGETTRDLFCVEKTKKTVVTSAKSAIVGIERPFLFVRMELQLSFMPAGTFPTQFSTARH